MTTNEFLNAEFFAAGSSLSTAVQNADMVPEEELALDWTLTPTELDFIFNHCRRGTYNLIRFAIQWCALRKTGRFVQEYRDIPIKIVQYLVRQLELDLILFVPEPERPATEYHYRELIRGQLGFCEFDEDAEIKLQHWAETQLQNDFQPPDVMMQQAEIFLLSQKIVLPPKTILGRKIASVRYQTQQALYEKIAAKISPLLREQLDQLLDPTQSHLVSQLQYFKRSPPAPSIRV